MENYEEKLKLAKDWYYDSQTTQKEKVLLEKLFSELKESEDERIRAFLHHTFTKQYLASDKLGKWHGEPVTNILAWLEKQGEQKPADKVEPIVVRDFNSVFNKEQVEEIDKRIEESQRLYNAKLRDAMRKVEDFPMTD